jgi:hypothetical protein
MTAHQRALVKTSFVIAIFGIIMSIATVWPPILGYIVVAVACGIFVGVIYIAFRVYEDAKEGPKW